MLEKLVAALAALFGTMGLSSAFAFQPLETASTRIVVISGFKSDPTPEQIARVAQRGVGNSGMYQLSVDLAKKGLATEFYNWNGTTAGKGAEKNPPGTKAIVESIRESTAKSGKLHLIVVGHSWGGHTMLEVAQMLENEAKIRIPLAIGLDPSSFSRTARRMPLPKNVDRLVNYHTRNAFVWGKWNGEERVHNIDLGDAASGFLVRERANYASLFDIRAHNAAEWDERIHADILNRIDAMTRSLAEVDATNQR